MPKVTVINQKKDIDVPAGANLREELRKHGIEVYPGTARYVNCFGHGACGTCKIHVKQGMENLSPRSWMEKLNMRFHPLTMLAAIGHEDELRLSCQCTVRGDCSVEVQPEMNLSGDTFWQKPYPNK
ncbi:MAG: (2Fe-2S)-binding protein [Gemmataceae bacterium]|nr:(2Fe-2S)-binding protein [Gemmataceae bacterium]